LPCSSFSPPARWSWFGAVILVRHADTIAERTGLGRIWVGSMLLAAATSLPELATDVAAVRLDAPDLAAGDLFGSSMANMLTLGVVNLLPPRGRVFSQAALDHALAACLAILLSALGATFVLAGSQWTIFGIGPETALLLVLYVAGTRAIYRQSGRVAGAMGDGVRPARPLWFWGDARAPVRGFATAAALILLAAPPFAWSAKRVAELTGLATTFVGTVLVGLSTSLPELVTSAAAVRLGAYDLAVGNLFGSNAFNMAAFFILDLAHPGGALLGSVAPAHALSALCGIALMSLGLTALVYRVERRFGLVPLDSVIIIAGYALGIWLLYRLAPAS
jgi:cation:H+ antiporter